PSASSRVHGRLDSGPISCLVWSGINRRPARQSATPPRSGYLRTGTQAGARETCSGSGTTTTPEGCLRWTIRARHKDSAFAMSRETRAQERSSSTMTRKKFKRYYTGSANGQGGKGDWRRDAAVPDEGVAANYCRAFGHRPLRRGSAVCVTCGAEVSPVKEAASSGGG